VEAIDSDEVAVLELPVSIPELLVSVKDVLGLVTLVVVKDVSEAWEVVPEAVVRLVVPVASRLVVEERRVRDVLPTDELVKDVVSEDALRVAVSVAVPVGTTKVITIVSALLAVAPELCCEAVVDGEVPEPVAGEVVGDIVA
jgi:hypothetical protein